MTMRGLSGVIREGYGALRQRIPVWSKFQDTGTVASIESEGVASLTDNGTGDYTLTWPVNFTATGYALAMHVRTTTHAMGPSVVSVGSVRVLNWSGAGVAADLTTEAFLMGVGL